MASGKELKDQGQGSYEMKEAPVDGAKLLAMKLIDKYSVTVLSLFGSVEPMKTVKRYDKKEKKFIEVQIYEWCRFILCIFELLLNKFVVQEIVSLAIVLFLRFSSYTRLALI